MEAERDEAYRLGREVPPPPEKPDLSAYDEAPHAFAARRIAWREREKFVLAGCRAQVEEQAAVRFPARHEKARKLFQQLQALLDEVNADLESVRLCRRAADSLEPEQPTVPRLQAGRPHASRSRHRGVPRPRPVQRRPAGAPAHS